MKIPELYEIPVSREMVDVFNGYNHRLRIDTGEFYDMENLTSDHWPVLSPRGKRGTFLTEVVCQGLICKDALCWVDGTDFVINGYHVEMNLSVLADDCPKRLVGMGAYVIILPDKKWINTADLTEHGKIEAAVTTTGDVEFLLCNGEGEAYEVDVTGTAAPEKPADGTVWMDTSGETPSLKEWSESSGMWVSIATTYIKIQSPGLGKAFEVWDGVEIRGLEEQEKLKDLCGYTVIQAKGDDYIVVTGILEANRTVTVPVTVERRMPEMDFVIESNNRLWGCRYGPDRSGNVVNEIYASKLGDFKNWNCFMGISTDSYAVSVGTDGQFTGAVTHLGYPCFFKEKHLHKVYGNYPANYQVQTTACRGVQKGCDRSLAIVGEVLYYKARSGVCAYDGSLPREISAQLGEERYADAVGGALGSKYYIAMKDPGGKMPLFVYDTAKGMWHKEESTLVKRFCPCDGELYYIDDNGHIRTILGTGEADKAPVTWMAETGPIGVEQPDRQYLSRLTIRLSMAVGTRVRIYAQYDSSGPWVSLGTLTGTSLRTLSVPVRPRRCDHLRLRIEGKGEAKIFSITKNIEYGSES